MVSTALKKRVDNLQKPAASTSSYISSPAKPQTTPKLAPSSANRLVVRNLPFDISEEDTKATFLPRGPIRSIDIPKTEDGRAKGFAFVWMMSKGDAQQAIGKCNGVETQVCIAEQLVQSKQKKKQAMIEQKISKEKVKREQEDAEGELVGVGRVIAVDWALSKDRK